MAFRARFGALSAMAAMAAMLSFTPGAQAESPVVYNSTITPLPSNVPSLGGEAYSQDEIGDHIAFADGARTIKTVTITMSSWACQSGAWFTADCVTAPGATFTHPIKVTLYQVDRTSGSPQLGAPITSVEMLVAAPFRPSSNPACSGGRWMDASGGCFNGYAFNVDFDFGGVTVPNEIIYGVAYNTRSHGADPIGVSGPYDSLNVGLTGDGATAASAAPSAGVDVDPASIWWDTSYAGFYSDGGPVVDTFRADSGWTGYTVAAKFTTTVPPVVVAADCMNGGYAGLGFRNQGQCIASVVSNDRAGK